MKPDMLIPQLIRPERLREELLWPKIFGDVVNFDTLNPGRLEGRAGGCWTQSSIALVQSNCRGTLV
jgi:hypothetical protein